MHRVLVLLLGSFLLASVAALADPQERISSIASQTSVNVTVYNGSQSLVHDRRRVRLRSGVNRIAWRDVSANMDATTALLENTHSPDAISVLEQNFNFDVLDPNALLKHYVGKTVTVVHDPRFAGERETRERARILSYNGGIVLQYADRIETDVRGHIIFPSSPATLRDRPTLDLDVQSPTAGTELLDLSYLTGGLSWYASYVGALSSDESHLNVTGLVTLSNTSGTAYQNAHLQLVAGNVNAPTPMIGRPAGTAASTYSVRQENFFEYHLYTLEHPTTILDNETKQVTLLSARNVPVRKTLELRGSPSYYQSMQPDIGDRLPVSVYVSFENKGGDLGIPLPGGIFRIYKDDSRGTSQFLGADNIQHTPKNETVRLHLGDSFDVTARKKQTDFRIAGNCQSDSSYEITLGNAKDSAQDVLVVEPIPGDWKILDENFRHVKSSASTANWVIRVPASGHTTLNYTARSKWCG